MINPTAFLRRSVPCSQPRRYPLGRLEAPSTACTVTVMVFVEHGDWSQPNQRDLGQAWFVVFDEVARCS